MGSKSRSKTRARPKAKPKSRKTASRSKPKRLSKSKRISKSKSKSKSMCQPQPGKIRSTLKRKSKSKSKSKRSMARPNPKKVVSMAEAKRIGQKLGINFKAISSTEFQYGMNIEIEHGRQNKLTNVTNNDLLMTGKIALAHILEYPDYYVRLKKMETDAEKYWSKKRKPNILLCK